MPMISLYNINCSVRPVNTRVSHSVRGRSRVIIGVFPSFLFCFSTFCGFQENETLCKDTATGRYPIDASGHVDFTLRDKISLIVGGPIWWGLPHFLDDRTGDGVGERDLTGWICRGASSGFELSQRSL